MPAACDPAGFAEAYVDGRLDIEGDVQAAAELASYLRKIRPPQILRWLDSHTHEKARVAHTLAADSLMSAHTTTCPTSFSASFSTRKWSIHAPISRTPSKISTKRRSASLTSFAASCAYGRGNHSSTSGAAGGALPIWAAKHYGVRTYGITLSRNQVQAARTMAATAGLSERVTVEEGHYQALQAAAFDKIA
jgi:hypothetical protein